MEIEVVHYSCHKGLGVDEIGLFGHVPEREGDSLSQKVLGFLKSTL